MINVVMCGHGQLALAMKDSLEMIYGECNKIQTVAFEKSENREVLVEKISAQLDIDKQTLILVDLFGGSPFNAAAEIAFHNPNIEVVTGMSLPLCLEMVDNLNDMSLSELVEYLCSIGANCVVKLNKNIIEDEEDF